MKKHILLSFYLIIFSCILLFMNCKSYSQNSDNEYLKTSLKNILPKNWTIKQNSNRFIISPNVQIIFYNNISRDAFAHNLKKFEEEIKKYGQKSNFEIYIEYAKKISNKEIEKRRKENKSILKKINLLPEKYKIKHLRSKGQYLSNNRQEKIRIEKYKIARKELENQMHKIPDFSTKRHSIYLTDNRPWYAGIWPFEVGKQAFEFRKKIIDNLKNK